MTHTIKQPEAGYWRIYDLGGQVVATIDLYYGHHGMPFVSNSGREPTATLSLIDRRQEAETGVVGPTVWRHVLRASNKADALKKARAVVRHLDLEDLLAEVLR
jgi:hypothetical protein